MTTTNEKAIAALAEIMQRNLTKSAELKAKQARLLAALARQQQEKKS